MNGTLDLHALASPSTKGLRVRRHKVLPNPEDAGPLKAILAHEALVHPDHPLRKEGKDGIDLTMGEPLIEDIVELIYNIVFSACNFSHRYTA